MPSRFLLSRLSDDLTCCLMHKAINMALARFLTIRHGGE